MRETNELLRSAYQIASREGKNTNWKSFKNNLERALLNQAAVLSSTDERVILRATCTPKTYRIP